MIKKSLRGCRMMKENEKMKFWQLCAKVSLTWVSKVLFICLLFSFTLYGQTQTITVTVTNKHNGEVLHGAKVKRISDNSELVTDSQGVVVFTRLGTIAQNKQGHTSGNPVLKNNFLHFTTSSPELVLIENLSLNGQVIYKNHFRVESGEHLLNINRHSDKIPGVCIIKVVIGNKVIFCKSLLMDNESGKPQIYNSILKEIPETALAKRREIIDTLTISHPEYATSKLALESNVFTYVVRLEPDVGDTGVTVTDIDGNVYRTATIGSQIWTAENFRSTRYNDSSEIPLVTDGGNWTQFSTGAYCFSVNSTDPAEQKKWGAYYNWYAVNTGKLAPVGWHVPSDSDWTVLENYLIANKFNYDSLSQDNQIAKSLASTTDWCTKYDPAPGCTGNNLQENNKSGFSALPSGFRNYQYGGYFSYKENEGEWWSASAYDSSQAFLRALYYNSSKLFRNSYYKKCGYAVRIVRD